MAGENLDVSSDPLPQVPAGSERSRQRFLGIHFACCDVYARIYVNRQGTSYEGRCPACCRSVRIHIDPHTGTTSRFFTAY